MPCFECFVINMLNKYPELSFNDKKVFISLIPVVPVSYREEEKRKEAASI